MVEEQVSKGIDPFFVGELVREGIEQDWSYIFTDNEFEPLIDERFAAIKQGFETESAGESAALSATECPRSLCSKALEMGGEVRGRL